MSSLLNVSYPYAHSRLFSVEDNFKKFHSRGFTWVHSLVQPSFPFMSYVKNAIKNAMKGSHK